MIILLSPSKTLDMNAPVSVKKTTTPALLDESAALIKQLKKLSSGDLQQLMSISEKLGDLNEARFKSFTTPFTAHNATPCIHAFKGDVYDGLDAASLSPKDVEYAQKHLRILSGLYGLLRPLDLMQPYRLEMGTRIKNPRGKDLYAFWGERISEQINQAASAAQTGTIVNLASGEYFKAVKPATLSGSIVTPVFKERKGNQLKVIGLMAKKARGAMARWLIQNRVENPADITHFGENNYRYDKTLSNGNELVFVR